MSLLVERHAEVGGQGEEVVQQPGKEGLKIKSRFKYFHSFSLLWVLKKGENI